MSESAAAERAAAERAAEERAAEQTELELAAATLAITRDPTSPDGRYSLSDGVTLRPIRGGDLEVLRAAVLYVLAGRQIVMADLVRHNGRRHVAVPARQLSHPLKIVLGPVERPKVADEEEPQAEPPEPVMRRQASDSEDDEAGDHG